MRQNTEQKFKATINIIGINPFVFVPLKILKEIFKQAERDKGPIPIKGTINGNAYRQTLVRYSNEWRLYINTVMLKNSPKRIGEKIEITVSVDTASREIEMPVDLAKALKANKEAALAFEQLTAYRKKEIVRYLTNLKTKESLERNITKAIGFLTGKEKFAGRAKSYFYQKGLRRNTLKRTTMCDLCFNEEIKSFPTEEDFEQFDLVLTKKIANDKSIKMGKFVNTGWKDRGYQVYECLVCGQKWKLATPDYSDRGYFLKK